jgi:threonine/homoserine/homoserine lactone efflux protein
MGVLLRVFAVLAVLIAIGLVAIVISVAAGDNDLREAVAIGYIAGAAVLTWLAVMAWKKAGRGPAAPGTPGQV